MSSLLYYALSASKINDIFIITISGKQCSIENLEFIDWAKDMKIKESYIN